MIKPSLKVNICGIEFNNPVIAASGTFGFGREYSEFYPLSLLGGISTKGTTLKYRAGNLTPRIAETASGMLNAVGLQNPGVDAFIEKELPFLRASGTRIIANIAGNTPEDYMAIAERLNGKVDMIEMNISCPNVKVGGIAFGILPESVNSITRAVKAYCTLTPLIVKLSPNVASISENAKAAAEGGADCISLVNTFTGMAIDIKKRRPLLSNITGGLSGPCIKPIALRMVYEACKAVKIPVIGMGGIMTASDAVEFLLVGAQAVQVGTANISNPLAIPQIIEGLERYLAENKINDINELIGGLLTD
ncbi:MAG: dihydroorotate dehydrogenase [Clostridia bacterium]|nr:dihydroorotate dehydrogenase [Clostridia bacterium]